MSPPTAAIREASPVQADKEDHGKEKDEQDQPGPQIRLLQDEQERDHNDQKRDEQFLEAIVSAETVAIKVFGQRQDHRQFDQFRRLEGKAADGDPPLGTPRGITGGEDDQQQEEGNAVDEVGVAGDETVIEKEGERTFRRCR